MRRYYPKRRVDSDVYVRGEKGRYTMGHGKHGKVKAGVSLKHGCNVAIKSQSKTQLLVAKGELELARSLRLGSLIKVFDWAEGPKKSYIVMEEAEPLVMHGATPERARTQINQIIEGLRELHARDIYHRDIGVDRHDHGVAKNIMVAGGVCKMTDLGKMACSPPAALRGLYAHADARGVCRVMHAFLLACDPGQAKPFYRWYTAHPRTLEDVAAYPWLRGLPHREQPWRAGTCLYPARVFTECITSPAPLVTGRRQPRLPAASAAPVND